MKEKLPEDLSTKFLVIHIHSEHHLPVTSPYNPTPLNPCTQPLDPQASLSSAITVVVLCEGRKAGRERGGGRVSPEPDTHTPIWPAPGVE